MSSISKIDYAMLAAAKIIYDRADDAGLCTKAYAHEFDSAGNETLTARLAKKGYIDVEKNPVRSGEAYRWLQGGLRPYQVYIKQQVRAAKDDFLILSMPTGTGKTRTAMALIQEFDKTLFITPRINLSHQTKAVFESEIDSIGIMQGSNSANLDADHIVCNLQTLQNRVKDTSKTDLTFYDCAVFDEIHYSYEQIIKLIPLLNVGRVIGLTGTPFNSNGTPLHSAKIIEPFNIHWFINEGYLAPVKCLQSILVDDTKLKTSKSEAGFTNQSIESVTSGEMFNAGVINATTESIKGQCIVFASSINHCELLATGYKDAGFECLVLHSDIKTPLEVLKQFKEKQVQLLITVNMVSFGTDIPEVETAVIARPIGSKSLYRQIVGRILRTSPDKDSALLLDCGGNVKRLGHPLATVRPPEKKQSKIKHQCRACGVEKPPYLFSFTQQFNIVTRVYKCVVCGDTTEGVKELETIECGECNQYHLTDKVVIRDNKEVLICDCGITTIIRELDELKLVFNDESLLDMKLRHYINCNKLSEASKNTTIILSYLTVADIKEILLEIETTSIEDVARNIQRKMVRAEKAIEADKARAEADYLNQCEQELIRKYKPVKEDSVKVALRNHSRHFTRKGLGGLSEEQIERISSDYHKSELTNLNQRVKRRIENIEANEQSLTMLVNFIPYIESHQSP